MEELERRCNALSEALNHGNRGSIGWEDVGRRYRDVAQSNRDVIRDALQQIGIGPVTTGGVVEGNNVSFGNADQEELPEEGPEEEENPEGYIDRILADEFGDLEELLEQLIQRGMMSEDQAQSGKTLPK